MRIATVIVFVVIACATNPAHAQGVEVAGESIESSAREKSVGTAEQLAFFESNIRPLLVKHCLHCHGPKKADGSLAFTSRRKLLKGGTRGPVLVPGKPGKSLLIAAVRHSGKLKMPKGKPKLDEASIRLLEKWIAMGAPWPAAKKTGTPAIRTEFNIYESDRKHWAFRPVVRPKPPTVSQQEWLQDDLDRFILTRLEAVKLAPAPRASQRTLMRRLSFDLTGLPPTPADLKKYLNPGSKLSLADYVDQLLASKEFGVHWGRHWLDQVRYRPHPKKNDRNDPYLQWVVKAFNDDKPYDQFLKMQIAGDLLPAKAPGEVNLDGLVAVRPWSLKTRHHQQIDLLGRTFLGLSLYCARCHDHKLEPLSRADYYAMQGIFESSQVVKIPFLKRKAQFDRYMSELTRTQRNELRMKKELKQYKSLATLIDLQARLAAERQKLAEATQNKSKIQRNIEKLQKAEQKRLADVKKRKIDLNDPKAREYMKLRRENNEFANKWKAVYQLDAFVDQSDPKKIRDAAPPKLGVETKPGKPAPTDTPIPRRFPTILAGLNQKPLSARTKQSGRLQLANWLADAKHPITARLITNRIWYYLLGEGLTPSLSNFGRSGRPPSHPELLDYLSDELVKNNWSMKRLIRRIVLSSTYQQSSQIDASPDQRAQRFLLFGVARRKRLEVESIYRTLVSLEQNSDSSGKRRDAPADMVNEMRLLFDGANRDLIVPRRSSSVSPLQALFLMNSEHVKASTERFAGRLHKLPDDSQRIKQAFLLLYGREAKADEIATGKSFLAAWKVRVAKDPKRRRRKPEVPPEFLAKWQAYLQVLLLTNEFLFVD